MTTHKAKPNRSRGEMPAWLVAYPSDFGVVAETERVVIRPWHPDEADRLYDLLRRMEVVKWLGRVPRPMKHRDEAVASIERRAEGFAAEPRFGPGRPSSGPPASPPARCC